MRGRGLWVAGLAGAVLCLQPQPARAQDGVVVRNVQFVKQLTASRAHRLGTSAGPDPDTVYVGKSYTNHTGPQNYWNIYAGTYRPGTPNANNEIGRAHV